MTNREIKDRYSKHLSEEQMATLRRLRNRRRKHKINELERNLINVLQNMGRAETPAETTVFEEKTEQ